MKIRVLAILGTIALLVGGTAWAATDTDTLTVTATVIDSAQILSVGNIAFGNYDPTNATATDANGSVTVRATTGLGYTVYIGADRVMTDGSDNLNYELYSDGARSSVWGSTLGTGESYTAATNANVTYTIYGQVSALQNVGPGSYSDTVTITLEW
jgi:spore coat protein U-like protein